jgi:heparan-alpha-glucosaminide N-acetyltransferase
LLVHGANIAADAYARNEVFEKQNAAGLVDSRGVPGDPQERKLLRHQYTTASSPELASGNRRNLSIPARANRYDNHGRSVCSGVSDMSAPSAAPAGRLLSLDAYRGFIMLAMVSAGLGAADLRTHQDWTQLRWFTDQLEHATWEGCTFWDLIQPSFMFMVGVSMPFAFARRVERGESWKRQFLHVCKRCLLLCFIGFVMDSFQQPQLVIQFIRVLQQIALGYFIAFLFLHLGPKGQATGALLLLAGHTLLFWWYGDGAQNWSRNAWEWSNRDTNVGRIIDLRLHEFFTAQGDREVFAPSKNFYVTINAISSAATILFGALAGELLKGRFSSGRKAGLLLLAGGVLAVAGLLLGGAGIFAPGHLPEPMLGRWLPMVKKLWTASFALYAAGLTCWMMLFFFVVIDMIGWRCWAFPFVVVGVNSIFIYFSSGVFTGTLKGLLKPFIFHSLDAQGSLGPWGPVALAVAITFMQWLLCLYLYRHRIFFKV